MMSGRKQYESLRRKWLTKAISGLLLFGFGLCLFGEAVIAKYERDAWVGLGTISLIITNTGLALFVSAAIDRIRLLDLRG